MTEPQVLEIELDRQRELRLTYDDGVVCAFALLPLRQACPCATCRNRRDVGDLAYRGDTITATGAELHGNWGISIAWSDGHGTGIYPWTHLRAWWDSGLD